MKKVAIIGLGIMGHGIADNFIKNKYDVIVWNRDTEKAKDLLANGARAAKSPKDAAENADLVFEVTANDESSQDMWLGDSGILAGTKEGQNVITCATLSVDWIKELSEHCQHKKLSFFDMPMTGSRIGAETGQLVLLVGGNEDKFNVIRGDLDAIARKVRYFGEIGSGTKYKLILNTLQALHIAGMGQAIQMAISAGIDHRKVIEALIEIPGGVVTKAAGESYLNQPEPIGFSVDWITKDLEYASDMIKDESFPLLDDVLELYKVAVKNGLGKSDWTIINET